MRVESSGARQARECSLWQQAKRYQAVAREAYGWTAAHERYDEEGRLQEQSARVVVVNLATVVAGCTGTCTRPSQLRTTERGLRGQDEASGRNASASIASKPMLRASMSKAGHAVAAALGMSRQASRAPDMCRSESSRVGAPRVGLRERRGAEGRRVAELRRALRMRLHLAVRHWT